MVSIWKIVLSNSESDVEAYTALVKVVTNMEEKGFVCEEIDCVLEKGNVNFSLMVFPYK